jgi:hypothetical protein
MLPAQWLTAMGVWSVCSVAAEQNLSEVLRRKIMAKVAQEEVIYGCQ